MSIISNNLICLTMKCNTLWLKCVTSPFWSCLWVHLNPILKLPHPFFGWELRNVLWACIQLKKIIWLVLYPWYHLINLENQLMIINVISNAWTLTTFTIIPLSYQIWKHTSWKKIHLDSNNNLYTLLAMSLFHLIVISPLISDRTFFQSCSCNHN